MNLKRRLRALERVVAPPDDRCEACGYVPGAPVEFEVTFDELEGPDVCPGCGRPLVLRVQIDSPRAVARPEAADGTGDGESAR